MGASRHVMSHYVTPLTNSAVLPPGPITGLQLGSLRQAGGQGVSSSLYCTSMQQATAEHTLLKAMVKLRLGGRAPREGRSRNRHREPDVWGNYMNVSNRVCIQ